MRPSSCGTMHGINHEASKDCTLWLAGIQSDRGADLQGHAKCIRPPKQHDSGEIQDTVVRTSHAGMVSGYIEIRLLSYLSHISNSRMVDRPMALDFYIPYLQQLQGMAQNNPQASTGSSSQHQALTSN